MGSSAHLMVTGAGADLLDRARERLTQLEQRWSRFLPDSELCRINAAGGRPVRVSADTAQIVGRSVDAWRLTGGLFDPTVLAAVESAGYDRTFEDLDPDSPVGPVGPAPGCEGIEVCEDESGHTVRLPRDVRLDLGGIGKGYAADQLVHELRRWGAEGACVNLGGDVRVSGRSPSGAGWSVGIADPFRDGFDMSVLAVAEGAVATSSRLRRRWLRGDQEMHHLIDPRTGEPARSTLVAVTVTAAEAHWAEIMAKSALVAGRETGSQLLDAHGLSALLVTHTGDVIRVGALEDCEPWTRSSGGTSLVQVA